GKIAPAGSTPLRAKMPLLGSYLNLLRLPLGVSMTTFQSLVLGSDAGSRENGVRVSVAMWRRAYRQGASLSAHSSTGPEPGRYSRQTSDRAEMSAPPEAVGLSSPVGDDISWSATFAAGS